LKIQKPNSGFNTQKQYDTFKNQNGNGTMKIHRMKTPYSEKVIPWPSKL
jgi:hypothetical protein